MDNIDNCSETALRELLVTAYGLAEPEVTLIRVGGDGNQTFKVAGNGGGASPPPPPFIARIYGRQCQERPEWARFELELLTHLARNEIGVAAPVAARDGTWMQLIPAAPTLPPSSGRNTALPAPVALFEFAEGGVEWPTSSPRARLLGAAFAMLHQAADSLRTDAACRAFDRERLLDAPLRRMRAYLDDSDPDDCAAWETLIETAARAAALFAAIPRVGGAIGPIHGDLHQGNCHFNDTADNNQLTFFDFSNAGVGWRVYDLSGFLWPLRDDTIEQPAIRAACEAFLDGYRGVRPLLPEEEKAIPASVKARDFWETGCWLEFGQNLDPATVRGGLRSMADQFRRFPLIGPMRA